MSARTELRMLRRRIGRRGAFLAFLMILNLSYGYSLLVTPVKQRALDLLLPWPAWGAIWITAGVLCAAGIFVFNWDRFSFAVTATLYAATALLFTEVWLAQKYPLGWVSVVVWLAFAGAVLIVSGWPEQLILADAEVEIPVSLPPGDDELPS